ncbi:unnamed protein product [Phytomonas sp. EM1]|nr:unnamed protein product [Phytomonas sp. EM1]|eukprot:CCW61969.1 unnamed protein product [Phytomonas sp. isolate EM1]
MQNCFQCYATYMSLLSMPFFNDHHSKGGFCVPPMLRPEGVEVHVVADQREVRMTAELEFHTSGAK